MVLTAGLQALVTYVPVFQEVFHTQALTLDEVAVVITLSTVVFVGVEVEKAFSGGQR